MIPHHMRDQRHTVVACLQNMIDQLPVTAKRDPLHILITHDHRTDVYPDRFPGNKFFGKFYFFRLQGKGGIRKIFYIVNDPCVF